MKLGCFSMSLSVKDLAKSKEFYEKLGFTVYAGEFERGYLIMKNEQTNIGLFQGMFEGNLLTFNPGWDQNASALSDFDDIRQIQKSLLQSGVAVERQIEADSKGPASFPVVDPDGNVILFDQHV